MDETDKRTVIIGASPNPARYAFRAASRLVSHNHDIIPLGIKKGTVEGRDILDIREKPSIREVHTITFYINPANQRSWHDYI